MLRLQEIILCMVNEGFNLYTTASTTELRLAFSKGLLYPSGPKGLDLFLSRRTMLLINISFWNKTKD